MVRTAWLKRVALLAGAAALLVSCATTKGSLFKSVAASEGASQPSHAPSQSGPTVVPATPPAGPAQPIGQATTTSQTPQAAGQSQPGLKIDSQPAGAHVYVNDRYIGDTPLFYTGFGAGTVRLTLERTGFYRSDQWINLDPASYATITVQLQAITGYLRLSVAPPAAEPQITVDTQVIQPGVTQLPIGPHTLTVSAFGYEDFRTPIDIEPHATVSLSVLLSPASFRFFDLSLSRPILNPANPGRLGEVGIDFKVSAPGTGSVTITSEGGEVVFRKELPPFVRRDQEVDWNGRAADGSPLPDGGYRIVVAGSGEAAPAAAAAGAAAPEAPVSPSVPQAAPKGSAAPAIQPPGTPPTPAQAGSTPPAAPARRVIVTRTIETILQISSAAIIAPRSLFSGTSGLLFAATPEVLPLGSFEVEALGLAHVESVGALIPLQVGVRFVPVSGLEIDAQGTAEVGNPAVTPYSIGAAGKLSLLPIGPRGGFGLAATAKATYLAGTTADILTNFTGFSVGMPLAYRIGSLAFVLDPEVILSPYQVSYQGSLESSTGGGSGQPALSSWGYGRAGVMLDFGSIMSGLSASVRTLPFSAGLGLDSVPLEAGWELHWLLPNSNLVLTAAVSGEFSPSLGYYLMGGAGIGLLH